MTEGAARTFKYSYRLFIKENGSRNAVELSHALADGGPTTIKEIEEVMKAAVDRACQIGELQP